MHTGMLLVKCCNQLSQPYENDSDLKKKFGKGEINKNKAVTSIGGVCHTASLCAMNCCRSSFLL